MNTYGKIFRITTFGESHGAGIGVVIDGCPAGLPIDTDLIQSDLDRRRPAQSKLVSQRNEADQLHILSGVWQGKSTGTPIALYIANKDAKSTDYDHLIDAYRPSHADFTYDQKYGFRDHRGGGRASARETVARVAAGAIAKILLQQANISITAYTSQIGNIALDKSYHELNLSLAEQHPTRCPDPEMAMQMENLIREVRKAGDTTGGVVSAVAKGVPAGWGEPVFDKLHAELGKAMLSINAAKGFEYGSGFGGVGLLGSQHNDIFVPQNGQIKTLTNYSGGIQGGISNGMDIYFRVAFKPVATIMQTQQTVNRQGENTQIAGRGRHDPCVVPRAVVVVEAMTALVLADFMLRHRNSKL